MWRFNIYLNITYDSDAVDLPSNKVEITNLGVTLVYAQVGSNMEKGTLSELTSNYPTIASTIRSSLTSNTNDTMFTYDYGIVRYRGANPNNYITFNEEAWRIIGIVDGYVKIVRQESLADLAWDSSDSNINDGNGYVIISSAGVYDEYIVRPVLYLKPNVVVTGVNGTSGTPYIIQLAS